MPITEKMELWSFLLAVFEIRGVGVRGLAKGKLLLESFSHDQNSSPKLSEYCGTGYLFQKIAHFPGKWEIICLWERE